MEVGVADAGRSSTSTGTTHRPTWLGCRRETGEAYRLLSEAEWEYVARAGTETARYWGESSSDQCRYANGADVLALEQNPYWRTAPCSDGNAGPAPVGSYEANAFGLHDILGNVWEWTQDCWNERYAGAPVDGTAWETGDCSTRVSRGGAWGNEPERLRSASRSRDPMESDRIPAAFGLHGVSRREVSGDQDD